MSHFALTKRASGVVEAITSGSKTKKKLSFSFFCISEQSEKGIPCNRRKVRGGEG